MKYHKGLLKFYIIGFILSIMLTLAAYFPITLYVNSHHKVLNPIFVTVLILILAFIQLIVQLLFFLHLGKETKPRWKLVVFISFLGIILTIVLASMWIMQHLNYNMSLIKLNSVMQNGEGF